MGNRGQGGRGFSCEKTEFLTSLLHESEDRLRPG